MPKTILLTGLVVAKSGTIDLPTYIADEIYRLVGFDVIRRGAQTHSHAITTHSHAHVAHSHAGVGHSHAHSAHRHTLLISVAASATAVPNAIGGQTGGLISSKAVAGNSIANTATQNVTTAEPAKVTTGMAVTTVTEGNVTVVNALSSVAGLAREQKTVINGGLATTTIPADNSIALTNKATITLANHVSDSLVGTEVVSIRYQPITGYAIPTA